MDWKEKEYHRIRQAVFVVEAVRRFPGICIDNRGKFFVLEWEDFTLHADNLHDVVHKLVVKIAEYPLQNGGMVQVARSLLTANNYDRPPVKRAAVYPRGLTCTIL